MENSSVVSKLKFFESLNIAERKNTLFNELTGAINSSVQPKVNNVFIVMGASVNHF